MFANIKIYPQNLWIVFALLLPNLLLIFFPAMNISAENTRPHAWKIVILLERAGQAMVFLLPLFLKITMDVDYKKFVLAFMIFAAILYYICWGRFYFQGLFFSLMYERLWFIPIPMAVLPVLYFFSAALLMNSWLYGAGTMIFAAGHLIESWYVANQIV